MNAVENRLFDPGPLVSPMDSGRVLRASRERSVAPAAEPVVLGPVWRLAVNGRQSPVAHAIVKRYGDRWQARCGKLVLLLTSDPGTVAPACGRCRA